MQIEHKAFSPLNTVAQLSPPADIVSVKDFGVIGDGVTDNTTQLATLRTWLGQKSAAGNVVKVIWPAGRYTYATSPNWALTGLQMEAEGEVWLVHTGAGASFLCDGGESGPGVHGMSIRGGFQVFPNKHSAQGIIFRAVHRSIVELVSRGAGDGYQACFVAWCVCTIFLYRASSNDGGWYNAPTQGLYITQRAAGEQTSYCTFVNPVIEGAPIGILLDGAMGNTFVGGTVEACSNIGVQLTVNAIQNKFMSIDFEENTNYDVLCQGTNNEIISCDTAKLISISGGRGNQVVGGLHQAIQVLGGASRTLLSGFKYNRASGADYPSDAGEKTRYRDLTNVGTGVQHNAPPVVRTLSVGASPYSYTNTSGNDQVVFISPGTLSRVTFVCNGGVFNLPITNGMYNVAQGESIKVEYVTAPAMYVLPR